MRALTALSAGSAASSAPAPGASSTPVPGASGDGRRSARSSRVTFDEPTSPTDSSWRAAEAGETDEHQDRSQEGQYDVSRLINNDAVQALATNSRSKGLDIQRYLEELGVVQSLTIMNSTCSETSMADLAGVLPPSPKSPFGRRLSATAVDIASAIVQVGRRLSVSSVDSASAAKARRDAEATHLKLLFGTPTNSAYAIREQHTMLGGVLKHIFGQELVDSRTGTSSGSSSSGRKREILKLDGFCTEVHQRIPCSSFLRRLASCLSVAMLAVRIRARNVVSFYSWAGFFLFLTLYSLFVNDIVVMCGGRDVDPIFIVINTIVFVCFFVELILVTLANRNYFCTVPFCLDMISLFSVFNDTWFMREGGFLGSNKQAARLSRMARTSKMTRLARIARVARVTKLIPRLLHLFRKHHDSLVKKVVQRRFWRMYLYLGTDTGGFLSAFDIKVFYLCMLLECSHLQYHSSLELVAADAFPLRKALEAEDQLKPQFDFDQFVNAISGTLLGTDMVRFHQDNVDQESGVWTMTQKLSDTTAMKVCVGILILVCMIALLEITVEDRSLQQTLSQLTYLATLELAGGTNTAAAGRLCEEVQYYVDKVAKTFKHQVLYVRLSGWTFYDIAFGGCTSSPPQESAFAALSRKTVLTDQHGLRDEAVLWECIPSGCPDNFVSAIMVDSSSEVKYQSLMAILTVVMAIVLLLFFVYVLNAKINMFSGNLLSPLRSLVDDMQAMSCLELVHIDEDLPLEKGKPIQVAEELESLQVAFKAMRSAIRSWSRYVPSCVVERLFASGTEATIGVAKCRATILFVDIDGFQDTCHGLSPNDVLKLLENVFNIIANIIQKQSGTLLEFIGDEVLAVFNTPRTIRHHPLAGVRSAQMIHSDINSRGMLVKEDGTEVFVRCRVGVHTSNILAGNIGSVKRMKYGLLGDGINQTARIKGLTSRYDVGTLCTQQVLIEDSGLVTKNVCIRPVDRVAVKGKQEPTTVYQVLPPSQGREWQEEAARKHGEGFKLYQSRRFEAAREAFAQVNKAFEENGEKDEPSRLLLSRCIGFIASPPPKEWDGVDRLKSKNFSPAVQAVATAVEVVQVPHKGLLIATDLQGRDWPQVVDQANDDEYQTTEVYSCCTVCDRAP